jgi:hypothetical protein
VSAGATAPGCEPHSTRAPRERYLPATAAGTEGGAWEGREAAPRREGKAVLGSCGARVTVEEKKMIWMYNTRRWQSM